MSGKFIVITGATRGLGAALVAEFVRLGHSVAGCGRDKKALETLRKSAGPPNQFEALDVSDNAQVEKWTRRVIAECGPPDLLLNNAAVINRNNPLWKVPVEEFDKVIDVNIKGVVNVIRNFVPAMIGRGKGVVVNFSSGWGRSVDAEVAPYCATKWAVEGLSKALALELPDGMACVPLNPGIINTDMLQSCFGSGANSYDDPESWAKRAAPFLLRISSRDNGQSLTAP